MSTRGWYTVFPLCTVEKIDKRNKEWCREQSSQPYSQRGSIRLFQRWRSNQKSSGAGNWSHLPRTKRHLPLMKREQNSMPFVVSRSKKKGKKGILSWAAMGIMCFFRKQITILWSYLLYTQPPTQIRGINREQLGPPWHWRAGQPDPPTEALLINMHSSEKRPPSSALAPQPATLPVCCCCSQALGCRACPAVSVG